MKAEQQEIIDLENNLLLKGIITGRLELLFAQIEATQLGLSDVEYLSLLKEKLSRP